MKLLRFLLFFFALLTIVSVRLQAAEYSKGAYSFKASRHKATGIHIPQKQEREQDDFFFWENETEETEKDEDDASVRIIFTIAKYLSTFLYLTESGSSGNILNKTSDHKVFSESSVPTYILLRVFRI